MEILLKAHNLIRWLVILTGLWAIIDRKGLRFYTISFDVQVLLGIILWINLIMLYGFEFKLRFFVMEHPVIMLLSLIFAHLSVLKSKSGGSSWRIWAILSYILLVIGTPWWRPLIRF